MIKKEAENILKYKVIIIDIAISGDRNVFKKEAKKIQGYTDFTIETERMWN